MAFINNLTRLINLMRHSGTDALKVVNVDGSTIGSTAPAVPATIGDGRTTVAAAGTRVALTTTTTIKSVLVQALDTNTSLVVVGGANVVAAAGSTRRGMVLYAGDVITISINDLAKVYIDSLVSGEGVRYTYVV